MPGIDYREVRARIPMSRVLELLGYQPKTRQGHQLRGPCPIHRSSNPQSDIFAAHLGQTGVLLPPLQVWRGSTEALAGGPEATSLLGDPQTLPSGPDRTSVAELKSSLELQIKATALISQPLNRSPKTPPSGSLSSRERQARLRFLFRQRTSAEHQSS